MTVSDIGSACAHYAKLLRREPDDRPMDTLVQWRYPDLRAGIQLFSDAERAGGGTMTLVVPEIQTIHPPARPPSHGVDRRRITLQNMDRDVEILIADAQGRDRIALRVDAKGEARIEIRDAQGKVTFRAPESAAAASEAASKK